MLLCRAQSPTFDAATVKMGGPVLPNGNININTGKILHGVVTFENATLSDCLLFAYSLTTADQIAGPDWLKIKSIRYEVVGKASPETPRSQILLMLQNLLRERFQMKLHFEPREMTHYDLVIGKNGPKLKESTVEQGGGSGAARLDGIKSNGMNMTKLATLLSRMTRLPVIDKTGLTGFYELDLRYANEVSPSLTPDDTNPSVFTAVQQQLGLKLESKKGPVEVLVVDHAEQVPVAN